MSPPPQIGSRAPDRTNPAAAIALAGLLACACSAADAAPDPAPPVRIMPLGDSITQGEAGRDNYRRHLYAMLRAAGHAVDFVGSLDRPHRSRETPTDYDPDHEGHWGWRADEVLAQVERWAQAARPHIVLLHIGTNDIAAGEDIDDTAAEVAAIIDRLRRVNPMVTILLARVVPLARPDLEPRITQFNRRLGALAARLTGTPSPVIAVDQHRDYDPQREHYDGVHPNAAGARKMAQRWFAALTPVLKSRQPVENAGTMRPGDGVKEGF